MRFLIPRYRVLDRNVKQPRISTGATQQIVVSSEEYIRTTFFRAGDVQCVERPETQFFEMPSAIRLGAIRNHDLLRKQQQHRRVATTLEVRIAA